MNSSKIAAVAVIAVIAAVAVYGIINGTILQKSDIKSTAGVNSSEENSGDAGKTALIKEDGNQAQASPSAAGEGPGDRGNGGLKGLTIDTENPKELTGIVEKANLDSTNYFSFKVGATMYDVNVGARWYWDYKGIAIRPGDKVTVTGLSVTGRDVPTIAAGTITNTRTGKSIKVREATGAPVWRDIREGDCEDDGIGGFSEE